MLKISQQEKKSFHNFKCGEIFCVTATVFNVTCCLCGLEIDIVEFPCHFQFQHLSSAEEFFNKQLEAQIDDLIKLENDIEKTTSTVGDDSSDDDDKGKKSLQEIIIETKADKGKTCGKNKLKESSDNNSVAKKRPPKNSRSKNTLKHDTISDPLHTRECHNSSLDVDNNKCLQELVIATKLEQHTISILDEIENSSADNLNALKKRPTRSNHNKILYTEEGIEDPLHTKDSHVSSLDIEKISNKEEDCDVDQKEYKADSDSDWFADDIESESKPDASTNAKDLPFPCEICKRSYSTKHSLQKHNHSVHNPSKPPRKRKNAKPPNKCEICNEEFRSAPVLRAHMWKHTGIVCDVCGRSFTQSGHLVRHKIRHTGIKEFKCKECEKEFFTAKELKSHMVCHTKIMAAICEICGKGCRNRAVLKEHMRRHTGERPAKCDVCGKCFFNGHDLNVHAVTHTSERPFKCDICCSSFQRKKALRVHKRIHSNVKRKVCKVCGKGFGQASSLNIHMRTHDAALEKTTTLSMEALTAECNIPPILLPNREASITQQSDSDAVREAVVTVEQETRIYMV